MKNLISFHGLVLYRFKTSGFQTPIWMSTPPQSDIGLGGYSFSVHLDEKNELEKDFTQEGT